MTLFYSTDHRALHRAAGDRRCRGGCGGVRVTLCAAACEVRERHPWHGPQRPKTGGGKNEHEVEENNT